MDVINEYLSKCRSIIEVVENQKEQIRQAARLFADTILAGRMFLDKPNRSSRPVKFLWAKAEKPKWATGTLGSQPHVWVATLRCNAKPAAPMAPARSLK